MTAAQAEQTKADLIRLLEKIMLTSDPDSALRLKKYIAVLTNANVAALTKPEASLDADQDRTYIAAMTMQGMLSNPSITMEGFDSQKQHRLYVSEMAVSYTDALLIELKKPTP